MTSVSFDVDAVDPSAVGQYLRSAGWLERQQTEFSSVWTLGAGDEEFELLLPLDRSFRDYRSRLLDVLHVLSLAESREEGAVLADMTAMTVDTQHFRLLPRLPTGSIPLLDVAEAIRGVRDLMYAAAHFAVERRPEVVQPRRRPNDVYRFVREVRMVAPAAGSFVLTAQVLVIPAKGEVVPQHARREEPGASLPNREIVLQLHDAVRATHRAAGEALKSGSTDPFLTRLGAGVSSNLCNAIGLIGKEQPFDLRFAWAQSAPIGRQTPRLRFDRHLIDAIRDAGRDLPRLEAAETVELEGQVLELKRSFQGPGQVTMMGILRTRESDVQGVTVTVTLTAEQYELAVQAHGTRNPARVVGQLRANHIQAVEFFGLS